MNKADTSRKKRAIKVNKFFFTAWKLTNKRTLQSEKKKNRKNYNFYRVKKFKKEKHSYKVVKQTIRELLQGE